jgi:hypothetical protein
MVLSRRLAALVTLAVAVAGCGTAQLAAGRAAPSASAPGNMTALARVARGVHCLPPGPPPVVVPLPADFVVAAAIRCVETERVLPGRGVWQFEFRQVAGHVLARLAAALRRPSIPPPPNQMCPAVLVSVIPFVLLGRDGRLVYPRLPTGECGWPLPQVGLAMQDLHWVTVSAHRGAQLETQAVVASGCPAAWKDMIGFSFAQGQSLRPSPGGPVCSARPLWLRVCVYRDRSGPLDTYFVGGGRVSGAAETTLLRGITTGRTSAACPRPHARFAVLLPPGMGSAVVYVEIGGCYRVLRPDNRIGQAGPAALAIIDRAQRLVSGGRG